MKLSIIIPNHNNRMKIEKTIRSIYDSKGINKHDHEIIVVDDASVDTGVKIIKKNFPTVKIIELDERKGAAHARNRGIEKAKGDLLLFLDSDMWFNKTTLKQMIDVLDKETDITFPRIAYENGKIMYPLMKQEKEYPHISGCFLIRKKSLKKLDENFDEYYDTYLEDYDFFIRCNYYGLKAEYAKDARVIHGNKDKKTDYSHRFYLEVRNTLYGKRKLKDILKKTGMYNPFTSNSLWKAFVCAVFNFAWFNWYGYDRRENRFDALLRAVSYTHLTLPTIYSV